jgi:Mrp family chromosome partitioning ATPase
MSNHVDGVLLVIQAAKTPQKTVKKALGLIQSATILGVVYNNVPAYLGKNLNPYYYYRYHQDIDQPAKTNNKDDKH